MRKSKVIYITLWCLIFFAWATKAQEVEYHKSQTQLSLTGFAGKIVPHSDTLKPLINGWANGLRFALFQKVDGSKAWHHLHNMPDIGFSFIYIDLGDNDVLGNAWGIQPSIAYQIVKSQNLAIKADFGLGLAYITQKYSPCNPTNVAISTSINYWATANLISTYKTSDRLSITTGIETNHFSNGSIKKPNYGLNIIGLSLGVTYRIYGKEVYEIKPQPLRTEQKPHLELYMGKGIKETGPAGGTKYYPISLAVGYLMPNSELFSLVSGIDIMYDPSSRYHIELRGKHYSPINDDFQVGLKAGLLIPFDRLSFYGQLGAYLYNPNPRLPILYQKLGIRFMIANKTLLQIELKTHLNTADHIEVGYVICIN